MRRSKLAALLLCSLLLCMFFTVTASADVGNVDGGGWDDGGWDDGGWDNDYSYDYGDSDYSGSGGSIGIGTVIVIVIIVIVFQTVKSKGANAQQGQRPAGQHERSSNAPAAMSEAGVVAAVRQTDPDFAAEQFKAYSNDVYLKVQEAWEAKDLDTVRPYISDKLYGQLEMQLRELISGKKTNHMDGQYIRSAELTNFVSDGYNEMIEVRLSAQLLDYTTDDTTGQVINGSTTYRYDRVYRLQFIRTAGQKTKTGEYVASTNCPCCGAPLEINQAGRCAYCDSVITSGVYGWVLNDYNRW